MSEEQVVIDPRASVSYVMAVISILLILIGTIVVTLGAYYTFGFGPALLTAGTILLVLGVATGYSN